MKAVLFDLDGVITDTAELHFQAWKEMAARVGISFDRAFNEELKGISRMESLEKILEYGGKQNDFSEEQKVQLATEKNNHYVELLKQIGPNDVLPGIPAFLEEIKAAGMKMAVASASKNAPLILNALGLSDYFEAVANPEEVKQGKPAPDIFLLAAKLVGAAPEDCMGVEDSTAGIISIKDAGMYAIGVGTPDIMKAAGADIVLTGTEELVLKSLLSTSERFSH